MKGNVSVFFCQNVIGFEDEHEKKMQCLASGELLVEDKSARYSLFICALYIFDQMFRFEALC